MLVKMCYNEPARQETLFEAVHLEAMMMTSLNQHNHEPGNGKPYVEFQENVTVLQ